MHRNDDDPDEGGAVILDVTTPWGDVAILAVPVLSGGVLYLRDALVAAPGGGLAAAAAQLAALDALLEESGFDDIVVEGPAGTEGARPGHRTRHVRRRRYGPVEPG